mmetsp:Transcript_16473/g.30377  ORF Transcript_16473/g.30377 Transcript_16473/m.30377 type:complete len:240 (+) Transcript_16473:559-1278(+)
MVFMWTSPQACLQALTSSYKPCQSPVRTARRGTTMSISVAPHLIAVRISSSLCGSGVCPAGKPVATDAIGMFVPFKALAASGTKFGYTQTAPVVMRSGFTPMAFSKSNRIGCFAFAHNLLTFTSVSSPANVVRSTHCAARRSHAACHAFFTERRVLCVAARRCRAGKFTSAASTHLRSSGRPGLLGPTGAVVFCFLAGGSSAGVAPGAITKKTTDSGPHPIVNDGHVVTSLEPEDHHLQ